MTSPISPVDPQPPGGKPRLDAAARCHDEWASVNDPPCHPGDDGWKGCSLCLAEPQPPAPYGDDQAEAAFRRWWEDEGSGMPPHDGEESVIYVERIARIAWLNGGYCALPHGAKA